MTTTYNHLLKTTIGIAAGTSAVCALAGKFTKSPTLHKVQDIATSIAIVGAFCYAYLNLGEAPVVAVQPAPVPQTKIPTKAELERLPNRDRYVVTEGTMNQFHFAEGEAACTAIAATALIKMLEGEMRNTADIVRTLDLGIDRYRTICKDLGDFKQKDDGMLSWDQCYFNSKNTGFNQELITNIDATTEFPQVTPIDLKQANPFLAALQDLENAAVTTSQGAILMIEPSTYSVSISPAINGRRSIQFFDSHGSHDFDRDDSRKTAAGALAVNFANVQDLANYLRWKSRDSKYCGLYHCWLPAPKANSPHPSK